jgi:hypothetical protein
MHNEHKTINLTIKAGENIDISDAGTQQFHPGFLYFV